MAPGWLLDADKIIYRNPRRVYGRDFADFPRGERALPRDLLPEERSGQVKLRFRSNAPRERKR